MKPADPMADRPPSHSPLLLASRNRNDLSFLEARLRQAGITHPLLTFADAESLLDYLAAVCIAEPADPRLRPCLLFLDDSLNGERGDVAEWIRRQPALQRLRIVMLSDGTLARTDRASAAAVQVVSRFPAAATLAWMVASACGSQIT